MILMRSLRMAARWLLQRAESFPIPIEDVMWVERCGHSVAPDGTVVPRKVRPWPKF